MKTLTIELPDEAVSEAEARARRAKMTLAEWIAARIVGRASPQVERDGMGYPHGWFERTAGSLADVADLTEPEDRLVPPSESIEL